MMTCSLQIVQIVITSTKYNYAEVKTLPSRMLTDIVLPFTVFHMTLHSKVDTRGERSCQSYSVPHIARAVLQCFGYPLTKNT